MRERAELLLLQVAEKRFGSQSSGHAFKRAAGADLWIQLFNFWCRWRHA
jgi:hypothetical protein